MMDLDKTVREFKALKANRREFITRLGSAGLGVAAGTVIAGCGGSGNGFANAQNGSSGPISEAAVKSAFLDIQKDENDHVTFLATALGANARPRPTFDPKLLTVPDEATLWKIASALENTGPGAYLGAAGPLASTPYIGAAASIAIVEGRHAGFLNILSGKGILLTSPNATPPDSAGPPQPGDPAGFLKSQEIPQLPSQVKARALPFLGTVNAGNVPSNTDNTGSGITYLNGGPGFPQDNFSDSAAPFNASQAVNILNYALFLEYLERDFYNINVTKLYGGSPTYSQAGP